MSKDLVKTKLTKVRSRETLSDIYFTVGSGNFENVILNIDKGIFAYSRSTIVSLESYLFFSSKSASINTPLTKTMSCVCYFQGEYSLWWILLGFLALLYLTFLVLAYAGLDL